MMTVHLFLAAALTVSAHAIPSAGVTSVSEASSQASAASPRQVLNSFARCLARTRADAASAVLALPTATREQMIAAAGMLSGRDDCSPAGEFELELGGLGLLGGLAEGLLAAQPQERNVATLASWSDEAIERTSLRPRNDNEDMALCVLRRAPQETHSLLSSAPDSGGEQQALRALVPHLGPCAPAGATLTFDKPTVRAQLAIAAYRAAAFLRTAPATASATPARN